jgi:hypothetical protein
MEDYIRVNRELSDERAPAHAASVDYGLDGYTDPAYLSDVVRFDLPLLGDIAGLRGVHLQVPQTGLTARWCQTAGDRCARATEIPVRSVHPLRQEGQWGRKRRRSSPCTSPPDGIGYAGRRT